MQGQVTSETALLEAAEGCLSASASTVLTDTVPPDFDEIWRVSQGVFELFTLVTLAVLGVLGAVGYLRAKAVRAERNDAMSAAVV